MISKNPAEFLMDAVRECVEKRFSGELLIIFRGGEAIKFKKTRVFKFRNDLVGENAGESLNKKKQEKIEGGVKNAEQKA